MKGALQGAEVADLLHPAREFGARFGGAHHLARIAHAFLRRDGLHPGLSGVGTEFEHMQCDVRLHRLEAARGGVA